MTWTGTGIVVVKTVILLLGSGITYIAFRAYRRTETPSLRVLSIGFGTITLGALLAGIAHQVLNVSLEMGVLINSVLVAIGLAIVMYSLYLERG
jgi:heme/copper-type cytochrome/quinol oxidase subunit 3